MPVPEAEGRVVEGRKWRWDWCWPAYKVALERQGGIWSGGKHVRGAGYTNDCEKLNEGTLAGWLVVWATPGHISSGKALAWVERALRARGWAP